MLRPTARTTPLTSLPRMAESFSGKSFCRAPDLIFQSMGFTLVAEVSTSTESSLNAGSGTLSSYFKFSGPPYSYNRTAFISPSKSESRLGCRAEAEFVQSTQRLQRLTLKLLFPRLRFFRHDRDHLRASVLGCRWIDVCQCHDCVRRIKHEIQSGANARESAAMTDHSTAVCLTDLHRVAVFCGKRASVRLDHLR